MSSSSPNKSLVGRAAAILTTGEVAGAALDLNSAWGSLVTADLSFTLGSLTNVTVRAYASVDGVTYDPVTTDDGTAWSVVLTGSAERCYNFRSLAGWKFFRLSLQGSGTTTSSSADYTYRYLRRGSQ